MSALILPAETYAGRVGAAHWRVRVNTKQAHRQTDRQTDSRPMYATRQAMMLR